MSDERTIDERWESDHDAHPGMAKRTFLTNQLFGRAVPDELVDWLIEQVDLHDQVHTSAWAGFKATLGLPRSGADGITRFDETSPHIRCRVQIEVVTDGRSRLHSQRQWGDDDWNDQ